MDRARAQTLLESMIAWDQTPALTLGQVQDLLTFAQRTDSDGLEPTDADWTGTYDLNAAAAEGWRWKAGAVAGAFDFGTDQQSFERSQMVEMCLGMSDRYRRRVLTTIRVASGMPIIAPPIVLLPAEESFLP